MVWSLIVPILNNTKKVKAFLSVTINLGVIVRGENSNVLNIS